MKIEKKDLSKVLLVLGVIVAVVGVSYALWKVSFSSTNNNNLTASCFNISFTDENNISIEKAYPLTDSEGKKLTPYTFTITNNCETYASYDINLEVLNTSTLTNMNYIKMSLDDDILSLVSSLDTTTKTLSNASSAYKITMGYLNANESKTYNLRLWLDENVTGETEGVQNHSFVSKITVIASYITEEPNPTLVDYVTTLANTDTTNLATDDYNNIRYIGADPNNYVSFDGDIWRIIGVMKNVDDGSGKKEKRVKIIKSGIFDEIIGAYSWDTSELSINNGYGVNEWSQADLMKLLNPGYESESVGGSLYWNNKSGTCYSGQNNDTESCDFTDTGVKDSLKKLLGDAIWNTGSNEINVWGNSSDGLTKKFYVYERSENTGKICTSGNYCNDTVLRTTTWTGKVGLMYPSDYGYATSGGSTRDRTECLSENLWGLDSYTDCYENNWLLNDFISNKWTLFPIASNSDYASEVAVVYYSGEVDTLEAGSGNAVVFPTVYLLSNVKILGGDGCIGNPFIFGKD